MLRERSTVSILSLVLLAVSAGDSGAVTRRALVADPGGGTDFHGALLMVDLATGQRVVQSDFGDPAQGPISINVSGVAVAPDGRFLAVAPFFGTAGALFAVEAGSGQRTVVSDFGDPAQGPLGDHAGSVALGPAGRALVLDPVARRLFEVDLATGQRTVLSDFSDPAQGPVGSLPVGIAVDPVTGVAWVTDDSAGSGLFGALFRVDLQSGLRVLVSDLGDAGQGPTAESVGAVAVEASGTVVVGARTSPNVDGRLLRVDPVSGVRAVLADFGAPGPFCVTTGRTRPLGLAVTPESTILATTDDGGVSHSGHLFAVDPATGERILVSCFADSSQGPVSQTPISVTLPDLVFADGFESGGAGAWSGSVP